jgi:hypothetical protein
MKNYFYNLFTSGKFMKKIIFLIFTLFLSFNALARKTILSTIVLKASESGKRVVLDAGLDMGIEEGDHAKFYVGKKTVAQGKCIKTDSSKSVWLVTNKDNSPKIVANTQIRLKTISSMSLSNTEHIVSISTDGLGMNFSTESFNWNKEKSGKTGNEESNFNLDLNYNYVYPNRFMLGLGFEYDRNTTEVQTDAADTTTKTSTTEFEVGVGYNFNKQIQNSWWAKASLGLGLQSTEVTDQSDFEGTSTFFKVEAGKRFHLINFKLANISYAPSLELKSTSYGKDFDDQGQESSTGLTIHFIKFDVLF